jgi:hypothetical protein
MGAYNASQADKQDADRTQLLNALLTKSSVTMSPIM